MRKIRDGAARRKSKMLTASALLALGATLAAPGQAAALEADGAPAAEETDDGAIVVTARRRDERLSDVPIAISVLTDKEIAQAGIESVDDFAKLVANVSFDNALNLGGNYLTIRGQTQSQYAPPPAAIVIDGVLTISPLQFNVDALGLEQIEVLKGPQGAIYGRNAIAGAINITTVKPGDEFEVRGTIGYGRGDDWKLKGLVSGPIVEGVLAGSAGVSYSDRRGQLRNITTGKFVDGGDDFVGRLRFVLTPADDIELDVKYTYSDGNGRDPTYVTSRSGNPAIDNDPVDSDQPGRNPRRIHDLSGKFEAGTGFGTATVTLAYVDVKESIVSDFDFSPLDIIRVTQGQAEKGFSQEIRFASDQTQRLRWLVGGYHVKGHRELGAEIFVDPFYFGLTPAPIGAVFPLQDSSDTNYYETWSAFGQLDYRISDQLELALALRYDDDSLRQVQSSGGERRASFSKWQPKATLTYKPVNGLMVYGSVGQGFRSGDFNASGSSFGDAVIRAESATTYEVGVKSTPVSGFVLNAALFSTDLKNGQFKLFDAVGATNVGINIDKTRLRGFELEASARLFDGFTANLGFGYTDSKVQAFTPPPNYGGGTAIYIGNRPPRAPKYSFNAGFSYEADISDDISLFLRPDYRRTAPYFWDLENDYRRPGADYLDIRLGVQQADGRWSVTGWASNILGERVTGDYQPFAISGHPLGIDAYYPAIGATYGIEFGFRF